MAAAGISEWRIEIFGRWGSEALLKYIDKAAIDAASHNLSAEVEDALAISINRIVGRPDIAPVPHLVRELALEELGSDDRVKATDVEEACPPIRQAWRRGSGAAQVDGFQSAPVGSRLQGMSEGAQSCKFPDNALWQGLVR